MVSSERFLNILKEFWEFNEELWLYGSYLDRA